MRPLAILLWFAALSPPASGAVELFPPPAQLPPSPHYKVEVKMAEGWHESYVNFNPARTDGTGANDQPGRSMSWTSFFTREPVRVRVTPIGSRDSGGVTIRPTRFDIRPEKSGDSSIEFEIAPGQKLSVEFEAAIRENCFTGPPFGIPCIIDSLMIFADQPPAVDPLAGYTASEIARIAPGRHAESLPVAGLGGRRADRCTLGDAGGKRVIHFGPGVHELGYWQVPNTIDHLHFAPGAVVFGAIDVLPLHRSPAKIDIDLTYRDAWFKETLREKFKITGAGILCGSKLPWHLKKDFSYHQDDHYWQHIKLVQLAVTDITLEDITLVDSPYWVVSFINDTDSRSRGRFLNFKMLGAWTYNNDGLPVPGGSGSLVRNAFIHANDDAFKLYNSGAEVENCTVWQGPNGAVFQFGWFPKSVRDVRVSGIDIIHNENWYGVGQSNRATFNFAEAAGEGTIENIHFDDIRIEGKILRLFGFKAGAGQQFRRFEFKNLWVEAMGAGQLGAPGRNYFLGDIGDFRFQGFTIGGVRIQKPSDAQFDFSPGAGGGFQFSN